MTTDEVTHVPSPATIWLTIAVLTGAFYFIEHRNAEVSSLDDYTISGAEMVDRAAEGDVARRLAIPALGLFGTVLLMRSDGKHLLLSSPLAWLLVAYLMWCALSILWSPEPMLTLRHVAVLVFCSMAAFGVARQFSPRDLCLIALIVSTLLVANSLLSEIALGTFRPLAKEYRFAGTLHPNVQAPYCATMAVTAACLARRGRRAAAFLWMLCLTGAGLLILTKSRTVCGVCLAALIVYLTARVPWQKSAMAAAIASGIVGILLFGGALIGSDMGQHATSVATIGRSEDTESLSGRLPLWAGLAPYLEEHPLIGYGYQTFWDPNRIGNFSHAAQWTVTDGHSAYLDTSLDLGLIGLTLSVLIIVLAIRESKQRYLQTADIGYGFLVVLIACRAVTAFTESGFSTPTTFVSFVMACGVLCLVFEPQASPLPLKAHMPKEMPIWQSL